MDSGAAWSGSFHVLGHSFGGAVALTAALARPDRVKSLTLYEPTVFSLMRHESARERNLFETILRVQADMRSFIDVGSNERAMSRFVDFWSGAGTWDRKPASQRDRVCPLAAKVVEDFRMLFQAGWRAQEFDRLRMPVLILRGDQSPPAATSAAELLAELIPAARLFTIPNLGHMAPVTHPELIASAVRAHFGASIRPPDCQSRRRGIGLMCNMAEL